MNDESQARSYVVNPWLHVHEVVVSKIEVKIEKMQYQFSWAAKDSRAYLCTDSWLGGWFRWYSQWSLSEGTRDCLFLWSSIKNSEELWKASDTHIQMESK